MNKSIAIVTGGTGAVGSVIVQRLVKYGCIVAIPVRSEKAIKNPPDNLKPLREFLFMHKADLTAAAEVLDFVQSVHSRFTTIDILVNAAGGYAGGNPVEEISDEEWDRMINLNLRSMFLVTRAVLGYMRSQGSGRIISMAAMPALTGGAKRSAYAVSKRGVIALTEAIADEVKGTGITANALAPGIILTQANRDSMPHADTTSWVRPEEIAALIQYLCGAEARSINGNVIRIAGGT